MDSDAAAYITAVEAADGASLPGYIKNAINALVVGLKADSNWVPIKASCLMAGPATLDGALVPFRGSAPTPFNFAPEDYNQITGLKGNGSNKYLNANRLGNADSQDSYHQSIYITEAGAGVYIGSAGGFAGGSAISPTTANNYPFRSRISTFDGPSQGSRSLSSVTGFIGHSRAAVGEFVSRDSGTNQTITSTSASPLANGTFIYSRENIGSPQFFTAARAKFYSLGENITLLAMDTRLATYFAALAAGPSGNIRRRQEEQMMMASRSGL